MNRPFSKELLQYYEVAKAKKDKIELYRAETYKQLQTLNLLDIVIEGGEGTEFLKHLQESKYNEQQHDDHEQEIEIVNMPSRPSKQQNHVRTRNPIRNRRSSESNVSYGIQSTSHEVSTSPIQSITNTTQQTNIRVNGTSSSSPEYQKPSTPYEDKIIPTLRNRNRVDIGQLQGPLTVNTDISKNNNDETESISGSIANISTKDDATAELNQAEMIEANQMMIVFDKNLVNIFSKYLSRAIENILFPYKKKNLRKFQLRNICYDIGHRWEIFLENSFPRLKQLQLCFDMPIDDIHLRINLILTSFSSFNIRWPIGHMIWRPHSNKTRFKLFTLPYAFDTLKLSTSNSRLFNNINYEKNFKSVKKIVLDATQGTINDITQQLIYLLKHYCIKTNILQIQNIVLPNTDTLNISSKIMNITFYHIKHLIINECDGRLFPIIFSLTPCLTILSVTGPLLLKYFLKIPSPNISYLIRIKTLELNCMQMDRQNRLNRLLNNLPILFPYLEHLTIDINSKLYVDLKIIKTILDIFKLISLKIQRTNKYILDKYTQDDRQVRNYLEIHSFRLKHSETYEIICKDSQLEIWL
ncbi:unnamed protein product [Rotaria sp. Silwood1]|nr:unnamed protein product [Rotaria sp. Silwood1]